MGRTFLVVLVCAVGCYAANGFLFEFIEDKYVHLINLCGISIILAVGLNVVNGLTGQFSLGHAAFMAIGAYVAAFFTTRLGYLNAETSEFVVRQPLLSGGWGFLLATLVGGCAAAVAGVLIGVPTLRLRGDYLAIATLGFGEIIEISFKDWEQVGGAAGLSGIPRLPTLQAFFGGAPAESSLLLPARMDTFWIFLIAGVAILCTVNLQRSSFGRALIAIRENELAAEVMGIRAARMKVMAFVYAAFFAGLAGALYAHYQLSLRPADFSSTRSIEIVVMLVLGGLGSTTGAVVGAVAMTILPEAMRPIEESLARAEYNITGLRMIVYSLALILLMLFRPQGIFGQRELSLRLFRSLIPGQRRREKP